jgi:hypothetical protein
MSRSYNRLGGTTFDSKSERRNTMSLQETLNAIKEGMYPNIPPKTLETMKNAAENLAASGILDRVLKVGANAPDFELQNTSGQTVSLKGLIADGNLVLSFYRGKW